MSGFTELNQAVLELWRHAFEADHTAPPPLIHPEFGSPKHHLLFVGLNPADPGDEKQRPVWWNSWRTSSASASYLTEASAHELQMRDDYEPYFGALRKFASMIQCDWEHIDLLFWRETSQAAVRNRFFPGGTPTDVCRQQMEISLKMIRLAQPSAIIVANAFASHQLKQFLSLGKMESGGFHHWRTPEGDVPLFLCSMLSGQRALDVYSRERLILQVRAAIKEFTDARTRRS